MAISGVVFKEYFRAEDMLPRNSGGQSFLVHKKRGLKNRHLALAPVAQLVAASSCNPEVAEV